MKAIWILEYIRNNDYIMDLLDKSDIDEAIAELKEAMKPKTCVWCKFSEANDQACTILTHAVLESDAMPKLFYCSLHEPKEQL